MQGCIEKCKEVHEMLKIGMTPGEYITLGDDIRIVFSGGTGHHIHLLVDAPKDVKILRSSYKDSKDKTPYYAEKEQTSYLKKR
jgi:carbon storage regulator